MHYECHEILCTNLSGRCRGRRECFYKRRMRFRRRSRYVLLRACHWWVPPCRFGDVYVLYIALRKHVGLSLEPSRGNFPHRPWLQHHINTADFVQHGVEIVHQTSLLPRAIHFVRVYQVL